MVRESRGAEDDDGAGTAPMRSGQSRVAVVDETGLCAADLDPALAMTAPQRFLDSVAADAAGTLRGVLVLTSGVAVREPAEPGWLLVTDHVNWTGDNPLVSLAAGFPERRFLDVKGLYGGGLTQAVRTACARAGVSLAEGVYVACPETAGAGETVRRLGADAAGPGLVATALAARFAQAEVAALCARLPGGMAGDERGDALECLLENLTRNGFWREFLAQLSAPGRASAASY